MPRLKYAPPTFAFSTAAAVTGNGESVAASSNGYVGAEYEDDLPFLDRGIGIRGRWWHNPFFPFPYLCQLLIVNTERHTRRGEFLCPNTDKATCGRSGTLPISSPSQTNSTLRTDGALSSWDGHRPAGTQLLPGLAAALDRPLRLLAAAVWRSWLARQPVVAGCQTIAFQVKARLAQRRCRDLNPPPRPRCSSTGAVLIQTTRYTSTCPASATADFSRDFVIPIISALPETVNLGDAGACAGISRSGIARPWKCLTRPCCNRPPCSPPGTVLEDWDQEAQREAYAQFIAGAAPLPVTATSRTPTSLLPDLHAAAPGPEREHRRGTTGGNNAMRWLANTVTGFGASRSGDSDEIVSHGRQDNPTVSCRPAIHAVCSSTLACFRRSGHHSATM